MRVKVSWDEGATFEPECNLGDCFPDDPVDFDEAWNELRKTGRYWTGGGAQPLGLIVRVRD